MDADLKHSNLAEGVGGLPTDEPHVITVDTRCFEVTVDKAQLDDRLDGVVKLEAGGQTFEEPLTEGCEDSPGILSFRFYELPWGSTANVSVILEATEETEEYTMEILKDAALAEAKEGAVPDGGKVDPAGTTAASPSSGSANEVEEEEEPALALRKGDGGTEVLDGE
jgi:hypothetical protein